MTFKEIQELVSLINKSNLSEFKLKQGDLEIVIRTAKYSKSGKQQIIHAPAAPLLPIAAPVATPIAAPVETAPARTAEKPKTAEAATPSAGKALLEIKSPMVGTFYRSPGVDKPTYVKVGDVIQKGSIVCIVEAMKLFNEIESEIKGKIVKICVNDATPVEYDQVLFLVEPLD
jgi:acetyl-CoA carboxylase biotin carboxyl carrier protein